MLFQRTLSVRSGGRRGVAVLFAAAVALSACSSADQPGVIAPVEGFAGLIAGDEPRAVIVGREILGNGGSAVDAAVAMAFAMTVTMPSRVGIAGGGVCTVFDSGGAVRDAEGRVYEFLTGADPQSGLVPEFTRAMALLHARHGTFRWSELVTPAENLARFGNAASRAFARDVAAASDGIAASPDLARLLTRADGRAVREGDRIALPEYSAVLAGLRRQGAGYLYNGSFSARLVEASGEAGVPMSREALRRAAPRVAEPVVLAVGHDNAYFPAPPSDGGLLTAQLYEILTNVESYDGADDGVRPHLFAEVSMRSFAGRADWPRSGNASGKSLSDLVEDEYLRSLMASSAAQLDETSPPSAANAMPDAYSAGFVVADKTGVAAACSFTMNGLFGSGKVAPGTGIVLPGALGPNSALLTPVVIGNLANGEVRFAATAAGGPAAPPALAMVMLETLNRGTELQSAIGRARLAHLGSPDITWFEPSTSEQDLESLKAKGHTLSAAPVLGTVNALYCPDGIQDRHESCQVAADRRGHGLAVNVQ